MPELSIGSLVSLAIVWEVTTPKPGNVHRAADFSNMTLEHLLAGAIAIGPHLQGTRAAGVGRCVYDAVHATRTLVGVNTNLGSILLLAPLAAVPAETRLDAGVGEVLSGLGADDAAHVYEAIRLAAPGGLGNVEAHDVHAPPPEDLLVAMRAAAQSDLIAAQYANGYAEFFDWMLPRLVANLDHLADPRSAIVHTHVEFMAAFPDSLIGRKRGPRVAAESAARAQAVLDSGAPDSQNYWQAVADLDFWLRADGHARNPGTTADFIATTLFAALRDKQIDSQQLLTRLITP
ncbi:MAG: triphosphoribosyl-dephospho-CoA synthase [Planctomycetota bacterium]